MLIKYIQTHPIPYQSPMIKYASGESEIEKLKNYATSWQINLGLTIILLIIVILLILIFGGASILVEFLGFYLIYSIVEKMRPVVNHFL